MEGLQEEAFEAEMAIHDDQHVGQVCRIDCEPCHYAHTEDHLVSGSYAPYTDCEYCERAWYAGQQGNV
jgi:hypothetical protein